MNLKNITWKSFWKHFSSWKNISLFEKAFLISALGTCGAFLAISIPSQAPSMPGPFSEIHPFLETAFFIWIAPCAAVGLWLMKLGMNPEYIKGGFWMVAFVNTFFWAFIFWIFARIIKLLRSKIVSLKKK